MWVLVGWQFTVLLLVMFSKGEEFFISSQFHVVLLKNTEVGEVG